MLNLPIAMHAFLLLLALFFQDPSVALTSPKPGEALRGLIEIQGRMDAPDFSSAELAFTFAPSASDPAAGWFIIRTFSQPATNPVIAEWDTTAVTDGDYTLRLRVYLKDGSYQDVLVDDLKILNNEPTPTPVPPPTLADFAFQPLDQQPDFEIEFTPTPSIALSTITPLPVNSASLSPTSITAVFWKGALAVIVLYAFFSLLLRLRKN